jgi:phosphoribosyl-ATP pyrophosphohydrolase/phosphoribosyl-AMP cyclohydrolase
MKNIDVDTLDWNKQDGLIPAIIQDANNLQVLMLGYMNREALDATKETGEVVFYSRSKKRLWKKGETSGHVLTVVKIEADCDNDTLLIQAIPAGPTCLYDGAIRIRRAQDCPESRRRRGRNSFGGGCAR